MGILSDLALDGAFLVRAMLLAVVAQIILIFVCYWLMVRKRFAAVRAGELEAKEYRVLKGEPEQVAIYTRTVTNQFELPMVFGLIVLMFLTAGLESLLTVVLAWAFVLSRIFHARLMLKQRLRKRMRMFFIGMIVIVLMLIEFTISLLFFAEL